MIDPSQPLDEQVRKLRKINDVLMMRVERSTDISGSAFALFQTAISLENEVHARTQDLQQALDDLGQTNTRLQQAHQEAVAARRDLANALEAVQEGFALFGGDDNLVMCNRRFRMLFPDASQKIKTGVSFATYAHLIAHSSHLKREPNQSPQDWAAMRLDQHGKSIATFVISLTNDRWIQISERHTPDGGSAILQTNITDMVRQQREEREKMLDQQARQVRITLDHMSQGVCTFDANERLSAANLRFGELLTLPFDLTQMGTSLERILGYLRSTKAIVLADQHYRNLSSWVRSGTVRTPMALEIRRNDGAILDANFCAMPTGGFVASFTDVTVERRATDALHSANETLEQRVEERTAALTAANKALVRENREREQIGIALREAKEAAETANLSKTRFLAAASHDLLQPMNAAKLLISTLMDSRLDSSQQEISNRLHRAFNSVESLLQTLLEMSKLDAMGAEFSITELPIASLFEALNDQFMPLAEDKGLRFRVRPSREVVRSDPNYLLRILQNLVSNAIKYTPSGGVLVACRRRGHLASIEVWDTGPGIEPRDQHRIFEEFQRLCPVGGDEGMGLGLSIVERACRQLGHPISLRSIPGRGSIFAISVPLVEGQQLTLERPTALLQSEADLDLNMIAAVVENDPEVSFAMTAMLESWGISVIPAASADGLLKAVKDIGIPPDIILADYHLDGSDTGLEAISIVRHASGRNIPAILVTADRGNELKRRARMAQVGVLAKPVEPHRLRSLMSWHGVAAQ